MNLAVEFCTSFNDINAQEWDSLTDGSPALSHAFLHALENTGCIGEGTGWHPYPLVVKDNGRLAGAVPLFLKTHSYGEYVFDWAWADAYERNGMAYYPKLLAAIPFTPATGPRLLSQNDSIQTRMAQILAKQVDVLSLSSAHVLFPDDASAIALRESGWLERTGVQFRWENEGFANFEQFLATLSHDKRKKIRQERKKILGSSITCKRIPGNEITDEQWDFFYRCYVNTYRQHHSTPYLTRTFFHALSQVIPHNTLLVIAERNLVPIAASFSLYHAECLYGRYWGSLEHVPGLHFELCYYQGQEFCIERGIRYFEGGAQGEHKLARGFRPRPTHSFHKIAHPGFEAAISQFLLRESHGMAFYQNELEDRAPYKKTPAGPD